MSNAFNFGDDVGTLPVPGDNEPIFIDYLSLMAEGAKIEDDVKRDLAKKNYLNIRERKSKKERFR